MATTPLLSRYQRMELRSVGGPLTVMGLAVGLVLVAVTQAVIPALPEMANALLQKAFHIEGLGAVTLLNDYLAVSMVLFFVGVSQLTRVLVMPREQRQLDVLLSKPLRRGAFLTARAIPVLLSTLALGVVLGLACAAAAWQWRAPGETVTAAGAFGSVLVVTSLTLVQLAVLHVVFLFVRDAFQALMVAFVVWMVPLAPASAFIYRPDLFDGDNSVPMLLVTPANLVWMDAQALEAGVIMLAAAALACAVLLRVAGAVMERLDL